MTYSEAIEFLYSLRVFGTKLNLENSFRLAELAGNPQRNLRFIHVAGTNGKGSTCAMLESIYRVSGLTTGLFTSPHLVSFTERIQVNRECISEEDVAELTDYIRSRLGGSDMVAWPIRPTFFEFVTVMALIYFDRRKCDLVIWETGLGGRLDSTNIVTPLASVITNIEFDHQHWLGNTIESIAAEKAGIIKPSVPVITGAGSPAALEVIKRVATEQRAPLTIVTDPETIPDLPLIGEHQQMNAAVALATVNALQKTLPVAPENLFLGLKQVDWSGRLQRVPFPGGEVLLDGAHNPDGARSLAEALRRHFNGREITLLLAVFKDKSWTEICEILVPLATRVFLVSLSERSTDPAVMRAFCNERWPDIDIRAESSPATALKAAMQHPFVVVAGSLHLVGEMLELLRLTGSAPSERSLNEWDASKSR